MRLMRIVTVICWGIAAAALIGLAFWFLTGTIFGIRTQRMGSGGWRLNWQQGLNFGGWGTLTGPFEEAGSHTAAVEGINSIDIDWISGGVRLMPYDGDVIKITEFAQRSLSGNERMHITASGGALQIRFTESSFTNRVPQKRLEVLVPQALSQSLGTLSAGNISGSVHIDGFDATTLRAKTTSGAIEISNSASRTLSANSISGSVNLSAAQAGELAVGTTSGSITVAGSFDSAALESVSGRISLANPAPDSALDVKSTSGSLDVTGAFGRVDASTLSGSINIKSTIVPSSCKVRSTSGSLTITVPNEGPIPVYHSSTSGRFSSAVPVTMQGRGAQFELSTLSGSTRILALD